MISQRKPSALITDSISIRETGLKNQKERGWGGGKPKDKYVKLDCKVQMINWKFFYSVLLVSFCHTGFPE